MINLAIIGAGWAGQRQARALQELDGQIQLTCLVDDDPIHLAQTAEALGVSDGRTDLNDVLADDRIDAVSLCTPHGLHCEQAIAAAFAGKHVLVEKPMAMTVDDATKMIAAAEANDVRLYVAESATYQPMTGFLRQVVESQRQIGEVVAVSVTAGFRAPEYGYPERRAWLADPALGGTGTWMLHGIHTVAQIRHIFGEVTTVYARQHRSASFQRHDVEATMSLQLTMCSGVGLHLIQTAEVKLAGGLAGYTILGDSGSLRADGEGCCFIADDGSEQVEPYPTAGQSAYAQELAAFAAWVLDGTPGPTTGMAERRSLAIVQAGYESAESGEAIVLSDRFGTL